MAAESMLKDTASGARIFSTDERARSKPISTMTMATISPATYSARPWPKGCSTSWRLPETLKPISVITDEPASDRLLNASARMAMEPVIVPASHLAANSTMFSATPSTPHSVP